MAPNPVSAHPVAHPVARVGRYQNLTDAEEAKKLRDARRFAKGLFYHVRSEVRPYVIRDDFTPFFGSRDSADTAFAYFDKVRNIRRSSQLDARDGHRQSLVPWNLPIDARPLLDTVKSMPFSPLKRADDMFVDDMFVMRACRCRTMTPQSA